MIKWDEFSRGVIRKSNKKRSDLIIELSFRRAPSRAAGRERAPSRRRTRGGRRRFGASGRAACARRVTHCSPTAAHAGATEACPRAVPACSSESWCPAESTWTKTSTRTHPYSYVYQHTSQTHIQTLRTVFVSAVPLCAGMWADAREVDGLRTLRSSHATAATKPAVALPPAFAAPEELERQESPQKTTPRITWVIAIEWSHCTVCIVRLQNSTCTAYEVCSICHV